MSAVAVVCCSLVATASTLTAAQKILSVDVQKVFENYEVAKASRAARSEAIAAADRELKEMYDSMVKLQEEISELNEKAENATLVDTAREKFRDEVTQKIETLRIKEGEFMRLRQDVNRKLAERRNKEFIEQNREIEEVAAGIAKAQKADIVLARIAVLYINDSLDITQLVIDKLNEKK
jgi:outer membrane protein